MKTRYSPKMEHLIGKKVRIKWFDGTETVGILKHNTNGRPFPYVLEAEENWTFYKSHVKTISEV